jgi:3-hydroxy-9,10-secoandrosta-1,3,5(10)-triene-9,17-dione monooxygenase reductase component
MSNQATQQIEFRNALGKFATGVTIITTRDEDGAPIGLTASSFNSLSLDPPLILWSLDKQSLSLKAFKEAEHFNVHILAHNQTDLSNRFAQKHEDKFYGIDWTCPEGGSPTLNDFAALFKCKTQYQYEGGDHIIFVGKVLDYETRQVEPLIFRGGRYADVLEKPSPMAINPADIKTTSFERHSLINLIAEAHFQSFNPIRAQYSKEGLSPVEYLCISELSAESVSTRRCLIEKLEKTGFVPDEEIFARLLRKELIAEENGKIAISTKGQNLFLSLLEHALAEEDTIKHKFSDVEFAQLRSLLQKLT